MVDKSLVGGSFWKVGVSALSLVAGLQFHMANAQDAPENGSAAEENVARLGTVTVTSQKRSQDLNDVPIAVSAYTGEAIAELGLTSSLDLAKTTPGFNIGQPVGEGNPPAIYLRGVGLNDFFANNSGPIGVYLDEVYLSSLTAQTFNMFDLERVEVLKGPQGTLYGRNTTGGAVRFISAKPTNEFEAFARARYGRFDSYRLEGALSGPLGDGVAARIGGVYEQADGFVDNRFSGGDSNNVDNYALRGSLSFEPGDRFDLLVQGVVASNTANGPMYKHVGLLDPDAPFDAGSGAPNFCSVQRVNARECVDVLGYRDESADFYSGEYDFDLESEINVAGGTVSANYDLTDDVTLTSITSYITSDRDQFEDTDMGPLDFVHARYTNDQSTFTQEIRASVEGANFNLIGGLFYLDETVDIDNTIDAFGSVRAALADDPDALLAAFGDGATFLSRHQSTQDTSNWAVFGQLDYQFSDQFEVVAGLRYTEEERDFETQHFFQEPILVPLVTADPAGESLIPVTEALDDDNVSFKLGLNYRPSEDHLIYGSVSTGFKSGGFNGGFILDPQLANFLSYDQETITAYEVGFKSTFNSGRTQLNAAAFVYDYEDLQVFTEIPVDGQAIPLITLANAANAEISGLEFDVTTLVADWLTLQAGGAFINAELKDFVIDQGDGTLRDLSGNTTPLTPELSYFVLARTEHQSPFGLIRAQVDYSWQDEVFFQTDNTQFEREGAYGLLGARLALALPEERWEFALWGRNLGDEEYRAYKLTIEDFGLQQEMRGQPQSYGVEISFRY